MSVSTWFKLKIKQWKCWWSTHHNYEYYMTGYPNFGQKVNVYKCKHCGFYELDWVLKKK